MQKNISKLAERSGEAWSSLTLYIPWIEIHYRCMSLFLDVCLHACMGILVCNLQYDYTYIYIYLLWPAVEDIYIYRHVQIHDPACNEVIMYNSCISLVAAKFACLCYYRVGWVWEKNGRGTLCPIMYITYVKLGMGIVWARVDMYIHTL